MDEIVKMKKTLLEMHRLVDQLNVLKDELPDPNKRVIGNAIDIIGEAMLRCPYGDIGTWNYIYPRMQEIRLIYKPPEKTPCGAFCAHPRDSNCDPNECYYLKEVLQSTN